jgi:hypothetical protein
VFRVCHEHLIKTQDDGCTRMNGCSSICARPDVLLVGVLGASGCWPVTSIVNPVYVMAEPHTGQGWGWSPLLFTAIAVNT